MLIGPFTQLLTMDGLPAGGPIQDDQLIIIPQAGIRISRGVVEAVGNFNQMLQQGGPVEEIPFPCVAIPGMIDTHTHLCYAGSRARDYALRVSGTSYQEIASSGGGILDTVRQTRQASNENLKTLLQQRSDRRLKEGVTTCEIKSGYGLSLEEEIRHLQLIKDLAAGHKMDIVSTCLAAHTRPPEYSSNKAYLSMLVRELFPLLKQKKLTNRIDIFVDTHAFNVDEARHYLNQAKKEGFKITMHADQFERGGALLAAELQILSADHLEASTLDDAQALFHAGVVPTVLPGATLGLGLPFPPARMLLDAGLPLVIASDSNPGSAPMGDLLTQATLLGANQRLTIAETLAAITWRAAHALAFFDRGVIKKEAIADIAVFPCRDFREICYYQGSLKPTQVFKKGKAV
jgi:imidazolonepropionase